MEMTNAEIAANYRQSKDRRMQIGILAELNACSRAEIETILLEQGESLQFKKQPDGLKKVVSERLTQLKGEEPAINMAVRIGVSACVVRTWCTGKCLPSLVTAVKIAKAYRVSTDWLLGLEGKE